MSILRMTDLDLAGKRVLIREDLNVPVKDGQITSEQRILAALPTLRLALEKGAAVMVTSHLGRPKEGVWTPGRFAGAGGRAPVANCSAARCRWSATGWTASQVQPGEIVLLENCRMNVGEGKDDEALVEEIRRALRCVRDGCLRHRAPRPGLHPWRDTLRPGRLRRPAC